MADMPGQPDRAYLEATAEDQPAANTCRDCDEHEAATAAARAEGILTPGGGLGIVHHHWIHSSRQRQPRCQWVAILDRQSYGIERRQQPVRDNARRGNGEAGRPDTLDLSRDGINQ